jgi:hypothetical protein
MMNHCACASAQLNAMAMATPAPSRMRFLITYTSGRNTRTTMVTPTPLRHVYHRPLRWQSVFSSPSPSIQLMPMTATFVQQFGGKTGGIRRIGRGI